MLESTFVALEKLFLALSDKTRLRLLGLMADGEVPVGFLADRLGESQPKISRHLAYLRSAGLVSARRNGKWVYYGVETQNDVIVASVLEATLRSITARGSALRENSQIIADEYISHDREISRQTYMNDWKPTELEVFLL